MEIKNKAFCKDFLFLKKLFKYYVESLDVKYRYKVYDILQNKNNTFELVSICLVLGKFLRDFQGILVKLILV